MALLTAEIAAALVGFVGLYALAQLVLAVRLGRGAAANSLPPRQPPPAEITDADLPPVAVLVAARNEAANLPRCLTALAALDYPAEKLTILIADDGSTDATAAILRLFCAGRAGWQVLTVGGRRLGGAKGKGNALAHLIGATTAELLLCCDADIAVPPTWARALVAEATRTGAALVVGTTLIGGETAFARAQSIDWQRALATLQVATRLGRPFTGMGNNQLLRRSAYYATGGYEALPFSVTEDFQLFQALARLGYRTAHSFGPEVLAWSAPAESWFALVQQRRRWVRGLLTGLTPRLAVAAGIEALVFPALLALGLGGWAGWGLAAWGAKIGGQAVLLRIAAARLELEKPSVGALLRYEAYLLVLALVLPVAAAWPGGVRWKGREL